MTTDEYYDLQIGDIIRYDYSRIGGKNAHTIEEIYDTSMITAGVINTRTLFQHWESTTAVAPDQVGGNLELYVVDVAKVEMVSKARHDQR